MSDVKKLIEQLEQSAKSSNIDPTLITYLYEAIKAVLGESGMDAKTVNVGEIAENYDKIRKLIEDNRSKLEGTVDSEKLMDEAYEDELEILKERIVYIIQNGEAVENELNIIRKRFKELKKITKLRKDHQEGMEKGQAAAEALMQATFGISKGWDDISAKGLVLGYGKGLMTSLSFSNVLASLTSKVFETMLRFDKARAQLFSSAQISRDQLNVGRVAAEMGAIGVSMEAVAAESAAALKQNFMSFGQLTTGEDSQLELLTAGIGTMSKLGVSMQTSSEFLGLQVKTFGKSPKDANNLLQGMVGIATALGRPPEELVSEFNKAQPILARFEDAVGRKIFKATMFEATKLNIEASKLLSLSEGMDTFEGAAQMAQGLNLAFASPIISAQALLGARDISERRKVIMDSMKAAGKSVNNLTERELRGLAQSPAFGQFGGNVAELKRFLSDGADTFSAEREGMDDLGTSMQDNQRMVSENLSMQTKLDAKFQEAINKLVVAIGGESGIMKLVDGVVYVIDSLANNLNAFMVLVGGLTLAKFAGPTAGVGLATTGARAIGMIGGGMAADPVAQQQTAIKQEVGASTLSRGGSSAINLPRSPSMPSASTQSAPSSPGPTAINVSASPKMDGFGVYNDGAGSMTSMVQPDISKQYVQPVFHKNDHFYAAKSDGAMAKALDEIITVVESLANKNSDLKLSISERGFGRAVNDGLNAIKRY